MADNTDMQNNIFLPNSKNYVFPDGVEYTFVATVIRSKGWEKPQLTYQVAELHDGVFSMTWGPYTSLNKALDACDELTAKAAEPYAYSNK